MAALFINRLAMSAPNETNGNKISSQPTKQKTGWLTGLANYSDFSGITNTIIGQTSPTKQKVSDAIDSFKIELSLNEYLQKMDDIVSQCIENLSLAINNEKDANTDFYSVLSYFSTLISNISPADFINVYLMGIVNQNGMNILTHQYLNNVYIQQNVGQLLNLVIDNYSKSIEEMVQIRKDDLLKRTSEKLDAFNIVLKQLNEERNNLLGE